MLKNKSRICKILFIFALGFFVSSCVVVFNNPLFESSEIDKNLLGKWIITNQKGEGYLRFTSDSDKEISLWTSKDNKSEEKIAQITLNKIGRESFAQIKPIENDDDDERAYLLAKYEIIGDSLTIWILDEKKLKAKVLEGKIKGEIGRNGEVIISETAKEFTKFLRSNKDESLFKLFDNLKRADSIK